MPFKQIQVRHKHKPMPWMSDDSVKDAMDARDRARAEKERAPCEENDRQYRTCRNAVKVAQHRACSAHFLTSYRRSKPTTWKEIRKCLISSRKAEPKSDVSSNSQPAWFDRLNQHFASVGAAVANSLAAADTGETLPPRPPRVCSGAFTPRPATLPELSAALKRMGPSKASGSDGITVPMLKMTFSVVGPHLLHVVNSCIATCELPPAWRMADVIPLHKGGDVTDPNNYRPISILSAAEKLCERVVCTQLTDYLLSHGIMCDEQYGFRPGQSTGAALLDAVTYTVNNIDSERMTSLVTADTSKAFDSVEHGRLLEKLGWYGIDQRWFRAWLSGRTQTVRGGSPQALPVSHGVIQGSILGPVLFTLLTNDLPQHIPYGRLVMYADDAQFLDSDLPHNHQDLKNRIEATLAVAMHWYTQNRLKLNPSKTELIIIKSRRQHTNDFSVSIGNTSVTPVPCVKILGVILDSNMTWEKHVSKVVQRCYSTLIALARIRYRVPRDVKQMLIESLVFPHIRYCLAVWGGCTGTQLKRIQKAINFGARIVADLAYRDRVSATLKALHWHRVEELVTERDVQILYKLIHDANAPMLLRSLINDRSDVSCRTTRATYNRVLETGRVRTEFARRSFLCRATREWNQLPATVRCSPNFTSFKAGVNELVQRMYIDCS